jgi:catalase
MVTNLPQVHPELAGQVAEGIGVAAPGEAPAPHGDASPALSQQNLLADTVATRLVAVLAAPGADLAGVTAVKEALTAGGARAEVLAPVDGTLSGAGGATVEADRALSTVGSVLYDGVVVAGGAESAQALAADPGAVRFVEEAYRHGKPVGLLGAGAQVFARAVPDVAGDVGPELGVLTADEGGDAAGFAGDFAAALAKHRFQQRPGRL